MGTPPVLVVTALGDVTADLVISELHRRGAGVVRLDPSVDFPAGARMAAAFYDAGLRGAINTSTRRLDLSAVRSVYWRRPTPYGSTSSGEPSATRFSNSQSGAGYTGVLASLPTASYVNHPWRNRDAEYKPAQLAAAARTGLTAPPTLVTNDPCAARRFVDDHSPAVYKPVRGVHLAAEDGSGRTIWVKTVSPDEIDDRVSTCPHLFQARVPKVADIRLAAVGEEVFATRIDNAGEHLDWRQRQDLLTFTPVPTPPAIRNAVHAYLDVFGLSFGAFDFALTADGQWVWLETNPNGQWAFVDPPTCAAITSALADCLQKGTTP
ncbi:ATP-grasp ribosomal peptide maturase [Streptomyces sp. NPDC017529]|uniref:ATP-grasp ribosomal peptide maturase n=1 Tax=Streptomyces sp. NPDC017529 TaxID=3365000 RepID=UPI0037B863CB